MNHKETRARSAGHKLHAAVPAMKNPTRQTKQDDLEALVQASARHEALPQDRRMEERLQQLQTFIAQLADTPQGKADLERRVRRLGECVQRPDESAGAFYGRLRCWLDVD